MDIPAATSLDHPLSPVDTPTKGTSSKTFLLSLFVFLVFASGTLYFFVFDRSWSLSKVLGRGNQGMPSQAQTSRPVGTGAVPAVPSIPIAQFQAKTTNCTKTAPSKAPVIVLSVIVVLILAGIAVGGYILYQVMADEQHATMQQVGILNDELREKNAKIAELENGVNGANSQDGWKSSPIMRWIPDIFSMTLSGIFFTHFYFRIKSTLDSRGRNQSEGKKNLLLSIAIPFIVVLSVGISYGIFTGYYAAIGWVTFWFVVASIICALALAARKSGIAKASPNSDDEDNI
jgi:flagellar basal body-associated protein FliL